MEAVEKQFLKITKNPVLKDRMIENAGKPLDTSNIQNIFNSSRVVTGISPPVREKLQDSMVISELEGRISRLEIEVLKLISTINSDQYKEHSIASERGNSFPPLNANPSDRVKDISPTSNSKQLLVSSKGKDFTSANEAKEKEFLRLSLQAVAEVGPFE